MKKKIKKIFQSNIALVDKALSMVIFIVAMKYLSHMFSGVLDLNVYYLGLIFGFAIALNQDFVIRAAIEKKINVSRPIRFSIILNISCILFSYFLIDHYINFLLFVLAISGRYEIVKYTGDGLIKRFQNIIAVVFSALVVLPAVVIGWDLGVAFIVAYIVLKAVIGELILIAHMHSSVENDLRVEFSMSFMIAGFLSVILSALLPVSISKITKYPDEILYLILSMQRSLSPAQQIGSLTSRSYQTTRELLNHNFHYALMGGILSILIYAYMMSAKFAIVDFVFLFAVAFHAALSGSWTLNVVSSNKKWLELVKILLAVFFLIFVYIISVSFGMDKLGAAKSAYIAHLIILYIPQFYVRVNLS